MTLANRLARLARAGLVVLLTGDGAAGAVIGIDPLSVLDTRPRANAVIILDSSGAMRDAPHATSSSNGISRGELVGDDPGSKLFGAKQALKAVILRSEARVSFKLGRFSQDTTDAAYFPPPGSTFVSDRFYYSTTDPSAASLSLNSTGTGMTAPGASRNVTSDTVTLPGTTPVTTYYLRAGRFWNGETLKRSGTKWVVDASLPVTRTNPATLRVNSGSATVVFTFKGVNWFRSNGNESCQGFTGLVDLPDCSESEQYGRGLAAPLENELDVSPDGSIAGYQDGALGALPASYPTVHGIRAAGGTPIAHALAGVRQWFTEAYWPTVSADPAPPRTFVVLVVGSEDNCAGFDRTNDGDQTQADNDNALAAAYQAQQLYQRSGSRREESVTTHVVAYGGSVAAGRANWIAWAGSGLALGSTVKNGVTIWNRKPKPTDADVIACKAAGGCLDAFAATDTDSLQLSLQAAIDAGAGGTEVSASPTQTASVYEFGQALAGVDPTDPGKRYAPSLSISLQSTFDSASFRGKLTAYSSASAHGTPLAQWEAGAKLLNRIVIPSPSTFSALTGGASASNVGGSSALVKRRIFTSAGNGVFTSSLLFGIEARGSGVIPVSLWPPDSTTTPMVAPANDGDAGLLDAPLGIVGDGADGEFTHLQSRYGACKGSPLPPNCSATMTVVLNGQTIQTRVARARREAREIILAHTAGAAVLKDVAGRPSRTSQGEILYIARSWVLGESTLAEPAIVGPPMESDAQGPHAAEYSLYRDGPRDESSHQAASGVDLGFGLRHPDRDGTATSRFDRGLKPTMTVAYLATNQMLHAFRAGPCPTGACSDGGGEELWGFVPFDQLGKLKDLATKPALRDPHTYMIATSPRFADVFVPAPGGRYSQSVGGTTVSGAGKWRTVLLFGRGSGGKHLTALDVTVPGPFTRGALDRLNPPLVLWSRGNPDTREGAFGGPPNNTLPGNDDAAAYAQMGETWSVPSLSRADPSANMTPRVPGGIEHVAYVGSGYSDAAREGHTFYALDALTGDVAHAQDVGTRSPLGPGAITGNALVASPSVFTPLRRSNPAMARLPSRIYIGDVQGRVWRFLVAPTLSHSLFYDFGPDGGYQPITTRAALLDFDGTAGGSSKPHVYISTGGDPRIAQPPFQTVGLRDDDGPSATTLFAAEFPDSPAPGYRGTLDPIATLNDQGRARVFFGGTQTSIIAGDCAPSTSSILVALTGETGSAAFDLHSGGSADSFVALPQILLTGLRVARTATGRGQVMLSNAIGASGAGPAPPLPPPSGPATRTGAATDVFVRGIKVGSPVCR